MDMEDAGLAQRRADWEELRKREQESYKADVKTSKDSLTRRVETDRLLSRLDGIMIEVARIGSGKKQARARVYRPGSPEIELYDTEQCTADTMEARLGRFLSQQIILEATRASV